MKKIVLLVLISLMLLGNSLAFVPKGIKLTPRETARVYWNMGNLSFINSNRSIINATFLGESKDFGIFTIPSFSVAYATDAVLGVNMTVGTSPKILVRIHWECEGRSYGWRRSVLLYSNRPFWNNNPPKGCCRLSFDLELNETERVYTWRMKVWIGKEQINTDNITYSFTLRRV